MNFCSDFQNSIEILPTFLTIFKIFVRFVRDSFAFFLISKDYSILIFPLNFLISVQFLKELINTILKMFDF